MEPVRLSIQSPVGGKIVAMSSTLVETVSINYEDFSESFLTCSTCLCTYDGGEHIPKLLPCSHTVCLHCLIRIVQASQSRIESRIDREMDLPSSFRCPICREVIQVPRGGVGALPPSFIVNQLLDLMARQRREVIPKCAIHPSQELLFCESCDTVFCMRCTKGSHGTLPVPFNSSSTEENSASLTDHTVVPFSIAIKRMSEILLYKANEVATKLNEAEEIVSFELNRLEGSRIETLNKVEEAYKNLEDCLRKAKNEALKSVTDLVSHKAKVLHEQLHLIQNEKRLVEREISGLQYQVEVRSLSDRITALQEKLESVSRLTEPRENCYIIYEFKDSRFHLEEQLAHLVCNLGRPRSSTALPSLCHLIFDGGNSTTSVYRIPLHIGFCGQINTFDFHGCAKRDGGDPVMVTVEHETGSPSSSTIIDANDGSYRFWFRLKKPGRHLIKASIFGRPIRNSPLVIEGIGIHYLCNSTGERGEADNQFSQPTGVAVTGSGNDWAVYILDSGNQRIAKYSNNLILQHYISSPACEGRSATGMCSAINTRSLWIANWRMNSVIEISPEDGRVLCKLNFPYLLEPVDIAINSKGQLYVADAGQSSVFVLTSAVEGQNYNMICQCGSTGSNPGQFEQHTLRAVTSGAHDDIVAADSSKVQVFSNAGTYIRTFNPTISKGQFGGLSYDGRGYLLVSYSEMQKSRGTKNGIWILNYFTSEMLIEIEPTETKLKRPGRLCSFRFNQESESSKAESDELQPFEAGYLYIADLGKDCIKQYRYL